MATLDVCIWGHSTHHDDTALGSGYRAVWIPTAVLLVELDTRLDVDEQWMVNKISSWVRFVLTLRSLWYLLPSALYNPALKCCQSVLMFWESGPGSTKPTLDWPGWLQPLRCLPWLQSHSCLCALNDCCVSIWWK